MKKFISGVIVGIVASLAMSGFAREIFIQGMRIYVKAPQENIRTAPQGEVLAAANKGAEMIVLKDDGKWVQVSLVGYIWKESVTANRKELLGKPYKAMMIVVRTEQEATDLLQKIRGGLDFAAAAKEHSIDAASARRGGDLGEFYQGELAPEFEQAILALTPNQLSGVVKTKVGYHIFKRTQ